MHSRNTTTAILILILVVLCFPLVFGVIGAAFGIIGGVFGAVFGVIGGVFGAVFGVIGALFGVIFDIIGGLFGWMFDWHWPFFMHWNIFTILVIAVSYPADHPVKENLKRDAHRDPLCQNPYADARQIYEVAGKGGFRRNVEPNSAGAGCTGLLDSDNILSKRDNV